MTVLDQIFFYIGSWLMWMVEDTITVTVLIRIYLCAPHHAPLPYAQMKLLRGQEPHVHVPLTHGRLKYHILYT